MSVYSIRNVGERIYLVSVLQPWMTCTTSSFSRIDHAYIYIHIYIYRYIYSYRRSHPGDSTEKAHTALFCLPSFSLFECSAIFIFTVYGVVIPSSLVCYPKP